MEPESLVPLLSGTKNTHKNKACRSDNLYHTLCPKGRKNNYYSVQWYKKNIIKAVKDRANMSSDAIASGRKQFTVSKTYVHKLNNTVKQI